MRLGITAVLLASSALAAACGRSVQRPEASLTPATPSPATGRRSTSASIITAQELQQEQRPLLEVLRRRLTNIDISPTVTCPEVHFRGRNTLFTRSDPAIYVDGLRTSNTCILAELSSVDVEQVEVYPSGIANRPGYFTNPNGLILIFIRKGTE